MRLRTANILVFALILCACDGQDQQEAQQSASTPQQRVPLREARQEFRTSLAGESTKDPLPDPPPDVFRLVHYDSPVGRLAAYLSADPGDGKTHPAIIWITGGDTNVIGDVWSERPAENDQSASAYRKAGIVMMFPSLRGGNGNPGSKEGFYGEVDDLIAAAEFLARQPHVDTQRIYLGGHSTGGTLALLVAECSDRFRAVFSFGPVGNPSDYGPDFFPFKTSNEREIDLRSPYLWLDSIVSPTFVIEGTEGNIEWLDYMANNATNANTHFLRATGADHFNLLDPTNKLIARKILEDTGPTCNIRITEQEVSEPFRK